MTEARLAKPARRLWVLATALMTVGCSTNGLADLPLPAPGVGSDGYRLTAVFTNALNLTEHASVKLAGADIGQVESITPHDFTAVTKLRVINGVRLPIGSTAELRSATPLGDIFVSIVPPSQHVSSTELLKDGDTIGLNQTTTAATVESVLSSAAILINGGAAHNLTNIVNGLGRAAGNNGDAFGELVRKSNLLLGKLDARTGQLETAITQTTQLANQLDARRDKVTELLQTMGPATETLSSTTGQISNLVVLLGGAASELRKFRSIAGTDTSGRSIIADANTITRSLNDVVLDSDTRLAPLERMYPPFIKMTAGSAIAGSGGIDRLVLGSIPDAGFGGDPGLHGPKRYDWNKFIGSLKFTLWRLQERVVGQGPAK